MVRVIISSLLKEEIKKKLKNSAVKIFSQMKELQSQPHKGKKLGSVAGILIKEIKYEKFRFYCITDGHLLKFGTTAELESLIIKFIRMSEKKDQQKVINEIKDVLKSFGLDGFN